MRPSDQIDLVLATATGLVGGIRPDQLGDPTPCEAWTVRDLVNHLVGGGQLFAAAFSGEDLSGMDANAPLPDFLGDDPAGAWKASVASFQEALARPGVLERDVALPFATLPAAAALDVAATDVLIHCWDLARATGQPFDPPTELVESAYAFARQFIGDTRDGHSFADAVPVGDGATPLDRLVAYAGRRP